MKGVNELLSLHETSNHLDRVIKEVDMPDPRVHGYIDQNKTIYLNKALGRKEKSITINHENAHKRQMINGRLNFDDNKYLSLIGCFEYFGYMQLEPKKIRFFTPVKNDA